MSAAEPAATFLDPEHLPDGQYAIVEALGHRTLVGRIAEVERFGTKLLSIEPLYRGWMLPAVLLGGGSIYQLTPVTAAVAFARRPLHTWSVPESLHGSIEALPVAIDPKDAATAPAALTDRTGPWHDPILDGIEEDLREAGL